MEIDVDTIARAHEFVIKAIMEDGEEQDIETYPGKIEKTWEYHEPIMIIVRTPDKLPMVSNACMFGERSMKKYSEDFTKLTPPRTDGMGAVYTYANRLFDYPLRAYFENDHFTGYKYVGNGDPDIFGKNRGFDQIGTVVDRLSKNKESRRAIATTWVPEIDSVSDEPPCLQFTHFMIRNCKYVWKELDPQPPYDNREFLRGHNLVRVDAKDEDADGYLHARFPFRSHDMLSGYGANAVGLTSLMQYVACQLEEKNGWNIELGSLTTFSSSAHLYWTRDAHELGKFKEVLRIS